MITFENTTVMNMKNAMLGARNPMNSWDRSDSKDCRMAHSSLDQRTWIWRNA